MYVKHGSKAARGLPANWEQLRVAVLKRDNYMCRCSGCSKAGRTRNASEVDHVISRAEGLRRGWTLEQINHPSNLAAINSECHKKKTAEEMGKRRRPAIGADGYPIDE